MLRLDIEERQPLMKKKTRTWCNTNWYRISWFGLLTYVFVTCLNYVIGYAIHRHFDWSEEHSGVRIFGDLVTVGWFAVGFVSLPWHRWEDHLGAFQFTMWWLGTIITFFVYGYMGQFELFQTSLASDHTPEQRNVYVVVFSTIGAIVIYWLAKLCSCNKAMCDPTFDSKVTFIRMFLLITFLFTLSYIVCSAEDSCTYHLHHWWFGFVLILLSTTSLDNWFDYFLQGIFWTFLLESLVKYEVTFGEFFI